MRSRQKMNHCAALHAFSTREEVRSSVSAATPDRRDQHLICPKPRRLGLLNTTVNDQPLKSLRWQFNHHPEFYDSKAGSELMDILLPKVGCGVEQSSTQLASSPPFPYGSPPSRVANPLIQDARFGDEKLASFLPSPPVLPPSGLSSSSSSPARKGGCVRVNFGNKPSVRIEGFDCLDRDQRNCSIPTLA